MTNDKTQKVPPVTLQINQPMTLRFPHTTTELGTVVTSIADDHIAVEVTSPMPQLPAPGDQLLARYWDPMALYCFFVRFQAVMDSKLILTPPTSGVRLQRRRSSRVEASIPFRYLVVSSNQRDLVGTVVREMETLDISLEGLRFETELPLEIGDTLLLVLNLSLQHTLELPAWVVWREPIQSGDATVGSVGVSFFRSGPEEQMLLLQFLGRFSTSDRRGFARWETSIPCSVAWGDSKSDGEIVNLSLEGALIAGVGVVPPARERVTMTIPGVAEEQIVLNSKVTSQVIHTVWSGAGGGEEGVGLFGVKFVDSGEELRVTLAPVLRSLFSKESPPLGV